MGERAYRELKRSSNPFVRRSERVTDFLQVIGTVVFGVSILFMVGIRNPFSLLLFTPLIVLSIVLYRWAGSMRDRERRESYEVMLKLLEEKYGEELPWIKEERDLTRATQIAEQVQAGTYRASS